MRLQRAGMCVQKGSDSSQSPGERVGAGAAPAADFTEFADAALSLEDRAVAKLEEERPVPVDIHEIAAILVLSYDYDVYRPRRLWGIF